MTQHRNVFSKLQNGIRRAKARLHLTKSELIDSTFPINDQQNISLEGCEVLTDNLNNKSMITGCNVRVTSNQVYLQNSSKNPQGHQVSVELDQNEIGS